MTSPETVAFLVYPAGVSLNCVEGVALETFRVDGLTHVAQSISFAHNYEFPLPLYGMLATARQIADSANVRYFDSTVNSSKIITQEDQCVDQEVEHYAGEVANFIALGRPTDDMAECVACRIFFSKFGTNS
jgi:hypothetical protein